MTRLANFASALSLLSIGALCAGCGANTTPGADFTFAQFDMLCDFEHGLNLNTNPKWNGSFIPSSDKSDGAVFTIKVNPLMPTRFNPDDQAQSANAMQALADGKNTLWGTAWLAYFQSNMGPVDLSEYTGITMWARADVAPGQPVPTVKVALADYGSFPGATDPTTKLPFCDMNDNTVGGKGCFDDYALNIFPDSTWRRYDIPFSQLTNGGWGLLHAFDPARLYALKFGMLPSLIYSIWIDDIALYRR